MTVPGTHDAILVFLSVAIAIFASYTALDLAARIRASGGRMRRVWLTTAAISMGGGIWAMHFVAMLAFSMPGMRVGYDLSLTLVSLLIAVVVTGIAFAVMAGAHGSRGRLLAAGLFMGLGVVAMHYMGMAAMRMSASVSYDRWWFGASVLIAIGAATVALWLASRNTRMGEKLAAALAMGAAIAGMHFAGMRAASFSGGGAPRPSEVAGVGHTALALGVFAASFLILLLSLLAAMFDQRLALMAEREASALRASEERFRSLYRGTPLPLHSLDDQGRIEQVSDAWLALMGYRRDEVVGRALVDFLVEDSARRLREEDWPALIAHDVLAPRDYRVVTRGGEVLDVVSAARIERDEQGVFVHLVGGLTDVTERKRAEEALRQAQKIEAIGHLTGGVAHDFNNLLAVVIGNLDLLRRRLPDDPALSRLVDSALEGARRGASLTQRLLAFARKQDLRPEAVDVPALVGGMADLLQRSLGPLVRVETRFPADLAAVHVDAHQLEMALLNLAVNARDAMPDGGTLSITAAAVDAGADAELSPGRYVRLTLADNGCGMDAATLARATEPFFTTKGVGKGTGLGLSMAHGLAAQSGGRLMIRSTIGQGTVIDLYLPCAARKPTIPLEEAPDQRNGATEPLTILVVDDDPPVLASTAAMLTELGHVVRLAGSGAEALQQLERLPAINLVLTDQLMPEMTGAQLTQRIRQMGLDIPVLIVSGFAGLTDDNDGCAQVLSKPFDQTTLLTALEKLILCGDIQSKRMQGQP